MTKRIERPFEGIAALPYFPVILLTCDQNVMAAVSFHYYSTRPPCVQVGVRIDNWTHRLIQEKKEFGVNLPPVGLMEKVRYVGGVSGRQQDKWAATGLTRQPATEIDSVLVAECPVNLECRVVHQVQYKGSHTWFIGQIVAVHIDDDYNRDDILLFWQQEFRALGETLLKY
jgi:flavin reductase (DIM6/NTAB) family NADH-FMN oxidoreductase RutF